MMNRSLTFVWLLTFACCALHVRGDMARPEVTLRLMLTRPTIDGKINEDEWAGAVRNIGLCSQYNLELTSREVIFWVGADANTLYIAMKSEVAPDGQLLTRAVPDGDRDIIGAVHDESVELVIHPHLGQTSGDRRYFHVIINARGAMYDRSIDEGNTQNPVIQAWRLKGHRFASQVAEGWWEVEMAIPFESVAATSADLSHPWGLRVCRNWQRGWDQSRWESAIAAYEDIPTMPRISFSANAPVVQVLNLRGDTKPKIEVWVANPGNNPMPVKVFISDTWSRNPPTEQTWDNTVPAGAKEEFLLEPPHGGPEGAHHTILRVTSPDAKSVYYLREFTWRLERPDNRWTITSEDKEAIVLQYKVYPYYNKLKARVDISALASKHKVTGARVEFARQGEKKPVVASPLTLTDHVGEILLDIPPLAEGKYEVRVSLQGNQEVPAEPVVGLYERSVFPWEYNNLGLSNRVIPPFTPIKVTGTTISTVLRDHFLSGAGVWSQVTSMGRPLLQMPMVWKVRSQNADVPMTPGKLTVLRSKPTAAITAGSFTAGPLKAEVQTEWDYDGMAKVFLKLKAAPGKSVDRLSLEIPILNKEASYLHACGDGLRFNYAGKTPGGKGVVWDSNKGNKINIVGTFYPYVWVGGGERGLAWFADNDKDWSLDDKTPTVELERHGATLTMRVHFITQPTALDRERQIVFGLQATPAKPMTETPVNWRRWLPTTYEKHKVQPFTIIGSSYYYGCRSFDFYPIDKDYSIYDAFSKARDTGQYDSAFVDRWMEKYKPFVKPDTQDWNFFLAHIRGGMSSASHTLRSKGWLWTPYTNPRGIGYHMEEWPTFQDEWIQFPYWKRSKEGGVAYEICPVRSFQDATLWYYQEMMRCFDGIYWDNLYLSANFDTVAGGAWVDEKGRIHPSMGLWAMRDLVRRTAVLFNEHGKPVFCNVVHMTNTNIVPLLSFANVNLDWEWQYGKRDFQDRFSADSTVAQTIGRQCGNIPLILAGGFYDTKDPAYDWVMRTRLGVCLVHEIRVWDWQPAFHHQFIGRLLDFGYGEKNCRVYNYWDEGFPLKISGCDAKAIVLVNGARAIAIVTDYSEGGNCTATLDLKQTGLPTTVQAKDFETGDPLPSPSPGVVTFPLKKHDFKAVVFE